MVQDKCRIACCFKTQLFDHYYHFILFSQKNNNLVTLVSWLLQIYVCGLKRCLNFGLQSENRTQQKLYTQNKHMAQNYWKLFHSEWGGFDKGRKRRRIMQQTDY